MQASRLASDLTAVAPDSQVLAAPPIGHTCGPGPVPVVRTLLRDQLLFATDSDLPLPEGAPVLDQVAALIRRDAPGWQITVLGHTDAVGSDAYNLDLSKRRADKVLRALVDRGIDPSRLSAVAIGKRQPAADNSTAAGRALNRRVEFLVSECVAANLGLVQQTGGEGLPVQVLRLDPSYGLASTGNVTLRSAAPVSANVALPRPAAPAPLQQPPTAVRPTPSPRYQPNTLSPQFQTSPLGPAVPF